MDELFTAKEVSVTSGLENIRKHVETPNDDSLLYNMAATTGDVLLSFQDPVPERPMNQPKNLVISNMPKNVANVMKNNSIWRSHVSHVKHYDLAECSEGNKRADNDITTDENIVPPA